MHFKRLSLKCYESTDSLIRRLSAGAPTTA